MILKLKSYNYILQGFWKVSTYFRVNNNFFSVWLTHTLSPLRVTVFVEFHRKFQLQGLLQ